MMKKNKISILVFLCFFFSSVVSAQQNAVMVSISNLRNNNGHVLISLFKDGIGYPDNPEKAFKKEKLVIAANKAEIIFNNLTPGDYAIAILHDENNDLKMNKSWLGLPKEGYGFSNNVMGTFGPPSYNKAKFTHTTGQSTRQLIRARY